MSYRILVRAWTVREERFPDRESAERFGLKLAASRPTLAPRDVAIVEEPSAISHQLSGIVEATSAVSAES